MSGRLPSLRRVLASTRRAGRRPVRFALLAAAGLAAACNVLPQTPPPPERHDFGGVERGARTLPPGGTFNGVEAPRWLEGSGIQYRFLHREPTRLRRYGHNRWAAPPGELLEQRIKQLGRVDSDADAQRVSYRWHVELDAFEQRFDSQDAAQCILVLRANVVALHPRPRSYERRFSLERRCAPDIDGALATLPELADRGARQVLRWVSETAAGAARDSEAVARCRTEPKRGQVANTEAD